VKALDQWRQIEAGLPEDWEEIRLSFAVEDDASIGEAAAVLGPLGAGRVKRELRFQVARHGAAQDRLRNLLGRLDRKRVWGRLTLLDVRVASRPEPAVGEERPRRSLVAAWDDTAAKLPPGWRDLLVELEVDSTDFLPQAALLGAPLNPTRVPETIALRFRVTARGTGGYGAPPGMVRRCFERMDAAGVTGHIRVLHALSETDNVATQGAVWRIAGKAV
jgi:hypothetical protein